MTSGTGTVHRGELRTMPQGHPDYRFVCQEMWRKIQLVPPALAESGIFMDWQQYRLGRLQSEMRTEFKKVGDGVGRVNLVVTVNIAISH